MSSASPPLGAYVLLTLMPLSFSTNLVFARKALETVDPWTLATLRWALAFALILPLAWPALRSHWPDIRRQWKRIVLLGFLGIGICGGVVYVSLRHTTATIATLLYTTSPIMVLLIERIWSGQKLALRRVIGILVATLGVASIILRGDLSAILALKFSPMELIMLLSAFGWALYSVVLKDEAVAKIPNVAMFAAVAAAGTLEIAPFMAYELATTHRFPTTLQEGLLVFGVALFPSVIAFTIYQYGVKVVGASVTSCFLYLLPVYGVGMAIVLLGEPFERFHLIGMILVLCGLIVATLPAQFLPSLRKAEASP